MCLRQLYAPAPSGGGGGGRIVYPLDMRLIGIQEQAERSDRRKITAPAGNGTPIHRLTS